MAFMSENGFDVIMISSDSEELKEPFFEDVNVIDSFFCFQKWYTNVYKI